MTLTQKQKQSALELLKIFEKNGFQVINQGASFHFSEFDKKRVEALPNLRQMLNDFLSKKTSLIEFKENSETFSRTYDYWGFKGFSGQMTLNQMVNWSNKSTEMEKLFRDCLTVPSGKIEASKKISEFLKFAPQLIPAGKVIRKASMPYFLSYFWQIAKPDEIPIQYMSSRRTLSETGILEPLEDFADYYRTYWDIHDELIELFSPEIDFKGLPKYWFVEHVLWARTLEQLGEKPSKPKITIKKATQNENGFEQFIPPILQDYEKLALGDGDSLDFERKTQMVFQMLGFEGNDLGQGKGREPDGIAKCSEHHYAILFDAKSRKDGYKFGQDDRSIREYIEKYEYKLKKEGIERLHFFVVSSSFKGNTKEIINRLLQFRGVKSVLLVTADVLLRLVAKRIEKPALFDLKTFGDYLVGNNGELTIDQVEEIFQE